MRVLQERRGFCACVDIAYDYILVGVRLKGFCACVDVAYDYILVGVRLKGFCACVNIAYDYMLVGITLKVVFCMHGHAYMLVHVTCCDEELAAD